MSGMAHQAAPLRGKSINSIFLSFNGAKLDWKEEESWMEEIVFSSSLSLTALLLSSIECGNWASIQLEWEKRESYLNFVDYGPEAI